MNNHLNISSDIQQLIDAISNINLNFIELPLHDHPQLPQFKRSIRVLNIDAKSKQEFVSFTYEQVLRDKDTDQEINISLPAPEWIIHKNTWSYLRDQQNGFLEADLKEPLEDLTSGKIKVPSYKYMLWLLQNDSVGFLTLLKTYFNELIDHKKADLDKLS
ncbi:hypothetical protein VUJ46_16355 [Chryseobacterium sp. MYb264]|uniref:hypothetical protein n=1 Tax=Chryseobacterium sp. MYb264 TaxID=2745153 RepID=UPI002E10F35E|nr:hypothetical protein VUJ46_16355 [Chryseobacterium sp. MYb264]